MIAAGVYLGLGVLPIQLEGPGLQNPWVQATAIGVSAKALLHIRLFSVTTTPGSPPFPIGVETLVQLFEPRLLKEIKRAEWAGVKEFVGLRAKKYPNLEEVRQSMKDNLPDSMSSEERQAFLNDVDLDKKVPEAMKRYLKAVGKKIFDQIFPA